MCELDDIRGIQIFLQLVSELIVESDGLLKHVTGSIIDETEMKVNAGGLILSLMSPMPCDTFCPKFSPC